MNSTDQISRKTQDSRKISGKFYEELRARNFLNWSLGLAIASWGLVILMVLPLIVLMLHTTNIVEGFGIDLMADLVLGLGALVVFFTGWIAAIVGLIMSLTGLFLGLYGRSLHATTGQRRFTAALTLHTVFVLVSIAIIIIGTADFMTPA